MTERILIIDDDDLVRTGLSANLERAGFDVAAAASGDEAIRHLGDNRYDLVVCDLVLGDTNGIDLLRQFQSLAPDMAVVMITGHGTVRNALDALRGGASDYIQKPADPEEVIHRIRMVLDTSNIRKNLEDERRRAEERKRFFHDQLIRSERMSSIGVMAEGAASDLGSILDPVKGLPGEIAGKLGDGHEAQTQLRALDEALAKAAGIVHDMQVIGRSGTIKMKPLNLNDVIGRFMDTTEYRRISAEHPKVRLDVDLDGALPGMAGSELHLAQALANLYVFQCELMANGGVVRIQTTSEFVKQPVGRYGSGEPGDYVLLQIEDTAMTLADEDLERLFEPFYVREKMGRHMTSGLALSLVYRVVQDHGGYIHVGPSEVAGNRFTLYFPVLEAAEGESLELTPDYTGQETILLVDDSQTQRDEAVAILTALGYDVVTAANGREAVAMFEEWKREARAPQTALSVIDLVLGDDFDGVETYKSIIELFPDQKAVMASGFSDISRIVEAKKLGILATIQKPYTLDSLGRTVRRVLDEG